MPGIVAHRAIKAVVEAFFGLGVELAAVGLIVFEDLVGVTPSELVDLDLGFELIAVVVFGYRGTEVQFERTAVGIWE